ncbi:translation initiation factor IF-2-like [Pundamilia nyererei]|uniref:Translation initiation factor IF-2-like n=1 Tax=Pundamilia nyererei TaxID=303518 RepID=A0A9Y3R681_9CICH|nr:PREDICTED: translation initiation factor IF-2-like [Pundamilia nyererei]
MTSGPASTSYAGASGEPAQLSPSAKGSEGPIQPPVVAGGSKGSVQPVAPLPAAPSSPASTPPPAVPFSSGPASEPSASPGPASEPSASTGPMYVQPLNIAGRLPGHWLGVVAIVGGLRTSSVVAAAFRYLSPLSVHPRVAVATM